MLRIYIVMKKNFPRKKRNNRKETRNEIKEKSSRKYSTQKKIVPHLMRIVKVIVTKKECSSWKWKLRKETLKITKNVMNKLK
jgi:hypothetical protein